MSNMLNWYSNIDTNSDFSIEYIYISGENITHEGNLQLLKDKKIDFLEYEDNQLVYNENFYFKKIDTDYLCCIMQGNHPLAHNTIIHPEELIGYDIYCWTSDSSATRTLYDYARQFNLALQAITYNANNVLNTCRSGNIYILWRITFASSVPTFPKSFRSFRRFHTIAAWFICQKTKNY